MGLFHSQKPILEIDYRKLCDAFVYTVFFRYLERPTDKTDKQNHAEIYSAIDIYSKNDDEQTIIQFKNWQSEGNIGFHPFIAIHQDGKQPIDIAKLYKGMEKRTLEFLEKDAASKDHNSPLYLYPITAGAYFKGNKMYSASSYEEFMEQGGSHLEILFQSAREKEFPDNLHEYYKKRLQEDWQKQAYNELSQAYHTKALDIYTSCLRCHITRKEFKYLKFSILDNLHIKVLNANKKGLFGEWGE